MKRVSLIKRTIAAKALLSLQTTKPVTQGRRAINRKISQSLRAFNRKIFLRSKDKEEFLLRHVDQVEYFSPNSDEFKRLPIVNLGLKCRFCRCIPKEALTKLWGNEEVRPHNLNWCQIYGKKEAQKFRKKPFFKKYYIDSEEMERVEVTRPEFCSIYQISQKKIKSIIDEVTKRNRNEDDTEPDPGSRPRKRSRNSSSSSKAPNV